MMAIDNLEGLTRKHYEALFIAPYATHHWLSGSGRSHWVELEGWQDSLAGPLSSIVETGGCEFVYQRKDWYYAGVDEPQGLRLRLLEWHRGLTAGISRFVPITEDEATDLLFMNSLADRMLRLIELACAVEKSRWDAKPEAKLVD